METTKATKTTDYIYSGTVQDVIINSSEKYSQVVFETGELQVLTQNISQIKKGDFLRFKCKYVGMFYYLTEIVSQKSQKELEDEEKMEWMELQKREVIEMLKQVNEYIKYKI